MNMRKKKELLSDKIADILSTTPGQVDPEDDIYEETTARVTTKDSDDEDIDTTLSKFRTQNAALLEDVDQRYTGKKSSRKSLKDSDEDWETEDEGLSTDEGEALDGIPGTQEIVSEEYDSDESSDSENEDSKEDSDEGDSENEDSKEDFDEGENISGEKDNFKHVADTNISEQMRKGIAVRNQLNIWENLLEIRIQLQKCLLTSNKFPQSDTYSELKKDPKYKMAVTATQKSVSNMLNKFLQLQSLLLKKYTETKNLLKKGNNETEKMEHSDEEIPSDTEDENSENDEISDENDEEPVKKRRKISDFESEIKQRTQSYKNYRNTTIQKWNDKTRLAVGKNTTGTNTVLQQIDYLLGDKQKFIRKSQIKKSDFDVLGKKQPEISRNSDESKIEYDTEIYDDTDFYHQLLRELIEVKSGDVTDPIQMSRQWIAIQNLRSKMKRKIDTKATKGRKIRYVVHSKLVNFMAPITDNCWTDQARNELYCSLFGKNQIVQ